MVGSAVLVGERGGTLDELVPDGVTVAPEGPVLELAGPAAAHATVRDPEALDALRPDASLVRTVTDRGARGGRADHVYKGGTCPEDVSTDYGRGDHRSPARASEAHAEQPSR